MDICVALRGRGGGSHGFIATPVTSLKVITPVIAQLGEQREGYKWEARETK
jgi:hypothetical protein